MGSDKLRILELEQKVLQLEALVVELTRTIELQAQELKRYRNKKNSDNSSIPPSQDAFRAKKTSSLREKSGKQSGGQTGHEGSTLTMKDTVDATIIHAPDYCPVCGLPSIHNLALKKSQFNKGIIL